MCITFFEYHLYSSGAKHACWNLSSDVKPPSLQESSLGSRNSSSLEQMDSMKKKMLTRFKSTQKALQTKQKIEVGHIYFKSRQGR